jgi:Ion transport protein
MYETVRLRSILDNNCALSYLLRETPTTCKSPACNHDPILCPGRQICEPQPIADLLLIDTLVISVFTVDYCLRMLLSCGAHRRLAGNIPPKWDEEEGKAARLEGRPPQSDPAPLNCCYSAIFYFFQFYNLVDVLVIMAYYISQLSPGSYFVFMRVLRLLRVLRLMRVVKDSPYTDLLYNTMTDSGPVLSTFAVFVGLAIVVFGCLISIAEDGTFRVTDDYPQGAYLRPSIVHGPHSPSPFRSIPDALYYVCITTSTVGYGDMYPTTPLGRAYACIYAYVGVFTWTFPLAIIGYNFVMGHEKLMDYQQQKEVDEIAQLKSDQNQISDDITSAEILSEAISILKSISEDTAILSKCSETVTDGSKEIEVSAGQLRRAMSPPGLWDWEDDQQQGG